MLPLPVLPALVLQEVGQRHVAALLLWHKWTHPPPSAVLLRPRGRSRGAWMGDESVRWRQNTFQRPTLPHTGDVRHGMPFSHQEPDGHGHSDARL
jgi:hypothetical protein